MSSWKKCVHIRSACPAESSRWTFLVHFHCVTQASTISSLKNRHQPLIQPLSCSHAPPNHKLLHSSGVTPHPPLTPLAPSTLNKGLRIFPYNHVCYLHNNGSVRNILHVSYSIGGWIPTSPQDSIHIPLGSPQPLQCWQKTTVTALMNHILLTGYKRLMNYLRDICLIHLWIPKAWEIIGISLKCTVMRTMIRHCTK